jgi:hypothetical protein
MIYVDKKQLNQVEYLIGQSIQGNHVLFDLERVRRVFMDPGLKRQVKKIDLKLVHDHIEQIIELPTLAQKRVYLERMDQKTFRQVVHAYLEIVENNLMETYRIRH